MIESGTTNLIFIMSSKKIEKKYRLKALQTIRKATSCKVADLLDSFVANGLIEKLVEILYNYDKNKEGKPGYFKEIENIKHDKRTDS